MKKVSKKDLSRAIKKVRAMDITTKEHICNDLFEQQPNLLASVLVQQQMGNTMDDVESLLHILLVLHCAIKEAGIIIPKITEEEQVRQLEILKHSILFSQGMSIDLVESSISQYVSNHKEPELFSCVLGSMREAGIFRNKNEASKYLMMAGINLVSCIADAKKTN